MPRAIVLVAAAMCFALGTDSGSSTPAVGPSAGTVTASHRPLGDQPLRSAAPPPARAAELPPAAKPRTMDYPRVMGALVAVIALIFVLRWCGKFFFPST